MKMSLGVLRGDSEIAATLCLARDKTELGRS